MSGILFGLAAPGVWLAAELFLFTAMTLPDGQGVAGWYCRVVAGVKSVGA
jgi:hypothetical protein